MILNGNRLLVYVNGVQIGCLTSNAFTTLNESIQVTKKDNGSNSNVLPGGQSSSVSVEGFYDPASGYSFIDLLNIHKNRTKVLLKYGYEDLEMEGYAYLNEISLGAGLNSGSNFSGTFTITGGWDYASSLLLTWGETSITLGDTVLTFND